MTIGELQRRLDIDPALKSVSVVRIDPGTMNTGIIRNSSWLARFVMFTVMPCAMLIGYLTYWAYKKAGSLEHLDTLDLGQKHTKSTTEHRLHMFQGFDRFVGARLSLITKDREGLSISTLFYYRRESSNMNRYHLLPEDVTDYKRKFA
ncbi:hypothetical protein F5Y06DRAFT_80649 [Hypoxylon sp. FL0890]|nr:hypothetical protein F5Y06DRAFT_80649 [Hypoxylon sp. FL0890]